MESTMKTVAAPVATKRIKKDALAAKKQAASLNKKAQRKAATARKKATARVFGLVDAGARAAALADLAKRDQASLKGKKEYWLLALTFVNSGGILPAAYFAKGVQGEVPLFVKSKELYTEYAPQVKALANEKAQEVKAKKASSPELSFPETPDATNEFLVSDEKKLEAKEASVSPAPPVKEEKSK